MSREHYTVCPLNEAADILPSWRCICRNLDGGDVEARVAEPDPDFHWRQFRWNPIKEQFEEITDATPQR